MISGTNWYGRGVTDIRPSERNRAAPERRLRRAALNNAITPVASPGLDAAGGRNSAEVPAFQWQTDADFVGLALGQWPQVQDAWFTRRQDNPVTPSRPNERSGREPALHYQPLLNPILKGSQ